MERCLVALEVLTKSSVGYGRNQDLLQGSLPCRCLKVELAVHSYVQFLTIQVSNRKHTSLVLGLVFSWLIVGSPQVEVDKYTLINILGGHLR